MNISSNNFSSIEMVQDKLQSKGRTNRNPHYVANETSFASILQSAHQAKKTIRFSKHANERLLSRNIDLSAEQLERLSEAAMKAKEKGIKESLVVMDGVSFIVNCKSNTVITAVDEADEHIFTNIDGAVIL